MADVRKEIEGGHGRYVLETDHGAAEMTFSVTSSTMIIVDHTVVPKEVEGQGFASKLAEFMVQDARENGHKIVPLCPYVNAWRRRHPDSADVFQV
ncbi:GNAT family N-acetyltransferase [Litoreibacter roseus]|uniref:N-acetyltransferase n=1 Tax=Litoreibacter roseus TaxID=2601869 RepID=A0A6N6JDJ5_9RHOB|nr:GNAT family N-acetyltransferase [Litoreibacter roseus]GFE63439.1 N-acetyltransferase [Litoreibacter roseus]